MKKTVEDSTERLKVRLKTEGFSKTKVLSSLSISLLSKKGLKYNF